MVFKAILPFAVMLAVSACSGGPTPAGEETAPAPAIAPDSPAARLTPAYLAGEWCYLRYEAGGEASEENITYDFAADGNLTYQTTSGTAVDQPGSYEIANGVLVIRPALAMFTFVPGAIDDQGMVLEAMGAQAFWTRGACGEGESE